MLQTHSFISRNFPETKGTSGIISPLLAVKSRRVNMRLNDLSFVFVFFVVFFLQHVCDVNIHPPESQRGTSKRRRRAETPSKS